MKYTVKVKEISYGAVEIEAGSAAEAEEKAEAEYYAGNVIWGDSEEEYAAEPTKTKERDDAR